MAGKKNIIRIESISGGHSQYERASSPDQFIDSVGINPDSADASNSGSGAGPTVITPTLSSYTYSGTVNSPILWFLGNPRSGPEVYAYDMVGSVYSINTTTNAITGIGDLNDDGSSRGNGAAYYDNYLYFARDTTIARYGPLNGTPTFTDNYWVTTLSKPALEHQTFPTRDSGFSDAKYPNHVIHRHKNGVIYFADTVAGQGVLHMIKTSKTTVEGDTDNGSTYGALYLPYGYFITDIDSYGDDLVIAAYEGKSGLNGSSSTSAYEGRSALFFWDTTSSSYYKVIQRELPDQFISALENANGVLYLFCCNTNYEPTGVRLLRYLGGNSFEQVALLAEANAPIAGGTYSLLNQIRFTSCNANTDASVRHGCVWSIGTQNQPFSNAIFCVSGARHSNSCGYAILPSDGGAPWASDTLYSYGTYLTGNSGGYVISYDSAGGGGAWDTDLCGADGNAYWKSRQYVIGSTFKITKVKLFFIKSENVSSAVDLRVKICTDMGTTNRIGATDGIEIGKIDQSNYPDLGYSSPGAVVLKPGLIGQHSFTVNLFWRGTSSIAVSLPIEIEYEIIDND